MTEPTYEELEIVARAMGGPDWAALDQIERNAWMHRAREAIKALDEYRAAEHAAKVDEWWERVKDPAAAEWDKRIQAQMDRFPKTRARLAESERNEVAEEAPKHKDDF